MKKKISKGKRASYHFKLDPWGPRKESKEIEVRKSLFEILAYDQKASKFYGEILAQLEKSGDVMGPLDLLIAAHALSLNLVLITNNEKEFNRVKSLNAENWVKM